VARIENGCFTSLGFRGGRPRFGCGSGIFFYVTQKFFLCPARNYRNTLIHGGRDRKERVDGRQPCRCCKLAPRRRRTSGG
jgi:hypothetical protein